MSLHTNVLLKARFWIILWTVLLKMSTYPHTLFPWNNFTQSNVLIEQLIESLSALSCSQILRILVLNFIVSLWDLNKFCPTIISCIEKQLELSLKLLIININFRLPQEILASRSSILVRTVSNSFVDLPS